MAILTPILTGGDGKPTYNLGIAETYSWVPIQNDQNRPMFARAGYITNLNDLTVSLTANDLNIGNIHISDPLDPSKEVNIVTSDGYNAMVVRTQDLESTIDDITIGDKTGLNFATVNPSNSALNVNVAHIPTVKISSVNISDANWLFQVGRGKITGATLKSFTGFCSAVDGSFQPIWENGVYTFLNSAQQLLLWSDSASDTNVSVFIDGLDSNYNPLSETLVLTNGTTGVTTVNSYYRINGINLTRTPMAAGNIRIGTSNKSIILGLISIGTDRSAITVYSVPAGNTFYLERVNAFCNYRVVSPGNDNTPVNAYYRSYTTKDGLTNIILQSPFYSSYTSTRISPRGYPEKTDCQWQCKADNGFTLAIGLQVEGILISNSAL